MCPYFTGRLEEDIAILYFRKLTMYKIATTILGFYRAAYANETANNCYFTIIYNNHIVCLSKVLSILTNNVIN